MPLKQCELIGFIYSHKTFTQLHIARKHNNSIFQNFKLWDIWAKTPEVMLDIGNEQVVYRKRSRINEEKLIIQC
jgi:hypothetical protein